MNKTDKRRIVMTTAGVLICGISVGMFKRAELGVDPFQTLMNGLNSVVPLSFGTLYVIANALLLTFSLVFDRRKIGLGTLINLFLLGYVADASEQFFRMLLPSLALPGKLILLMVAIIVMCFSSGLYFTADMGVSTYDAISLILSEKQTKVSFKVLRITSDLVCVCGGLLLLKGAGWSWQNIGTIIGIGTIITAFFMGPLIEVFRKVCRRFLEQNP